MNFPRATVFPRASKLSGAAAERLAIYLQDHHAASAGGEQLAERCASSNDGTDLGRYLRDEFLPELCHDRRLLRATMDAVGVAPSTVKDLGAHAGEVVGRFKWNGQLTGYSPLSRLLELEGLIAGVNAKRALWVAIDALRTELGADSIPDVADRIDVAERQRRELHTHHERAVLPALAADGGN